MVWQWIFLDWAMLVWILTLVDHIFIIFLLKSCWIREKLTLILICHELNLVRRGNLEWILSITSIFLALLVYRIWEYFYLTLVVDDFWIWIFYRIIFVDELLILNVDFIILNYMCWFNSWPHFWTLLTRNLPRDWWHSVNFLICWLFLNSLWAKFLFFYLLNFICLLYDLLRFIWINLLFYLLIFLLRFINFFNCNRINLILIIRYLRLWALFLILFIRN